MLKIGITGGIGAGKTTICRVFEAMGIPVYDADSRAKWLMQHDPVLRADVVAIFGDEAYLPDGSLNRAYISERAFSDLDIIKRLNTKVHPAVFRDTDIWFEAQAGKPYALKEAALLIESGGHRHLDGLIVVTAPEEVRVARVMQRDGHTKEAVMARVRNQMPEAEKVTLADWVIANDGEHPLIPQIVKVHRAIILKNKAGL